MVPEEVAIELQAEKLRLAALEAREFTKEQSLFFGTGFGLVGLGLVVDYVLYEPWKPGSVLSLTAVTSVLAGAGFLGLSFISYRGNFLSSAAAFKLWRRAEQLAKTKTADPEVYLAEVETSFQEAVQRAAGWRRVNGAVIVGIGAWMVVSQAVTLARAGPFTAAELVRAEGPGTLVAVAGLFLAILYKTPIESAWNTYINDKNLERNYVSVVPWAGPAPGGCIAGLTGRF